MKKMSQLGLVGLLLTSISFGQEFSLEQAKSYALENNLSVANADIDVDIMQKRKLENAAIGLPQISASGGFTNFINLPVQVVQAKFLNPAAPDDEFIDFRAGTNYSANGTLQVNQLLFNGSYFVALEVSKFLIQMQENIALNTRETTLFNVQQAYNISAVAKQNLVFVDSLVEVTQQLVDKQKGFYEVGFIKAEDLDQLNYALLTAQYAQTNAKNQYQNALVALKMAMGYPIEEPIEITQSGSELMNQLSLKEKMDVSNNMSLLLLQNKAELEHYNLKNLKMTQYPSLYATFNHQYNAYRDKFNFFADERWFAQTFWGLSLNIPIFSGGQKYAQIAQSKMTIMKNENDLKLLEQNLKMQEVQLQNSLLSAKAQMMLQEENVKLANKIYANAVAKEQIGTSNSLEVTQKYNQLIQAQTQYVSSMMEVLNTQLSLDKLYNNLMN